MNLGLHSQLRRRLQALLKVGAIRQRFVVPQELVLRRHLDPNHQGLGAERWRRAGGHFHVDRMQLDRDRDDEHHQQHQQHINQGRDVHARAKLGLGGIKRFVKVNRHGASAP